MNTTTNHTGTVEHIDPRSLVIEANVRPSAPITPAFVGSIRENGVLTPVLARRDERGNVLVRAGQRRTLAAREAGVATIPVYVVEASEATAERIIQQMVENDQREALTQGDRAAAFQQLALQGLSVTAIAKRTGTKAKEVKTALTVADSPVAASAINTHHALTLDQAAVLIEFEDDEALRAELIEVATTEPAQFEHAAQRARDDRARAKIKADAETALAARGFEILDREYWYNDSAYTNVRELRTADGERVTPEHIEKAEGRAVYVSAPWGTDTARISYYLSDPRAAGFVKEGGAASGPMTDEQKAERRTLIANNKAWASAETVRREWLASFLSRKTLPKDAAAFVAKVLTIHRRNVGEATRDGNTLAHELLGIEQAGYGNPDKLAAIIEQTPAKAGHVALAIVLGGIESHTSKQTWRYPAAVDAAYFAQLAAWGYGLSEVEQIVTAAADDDQD